MIQIYNSLPDFHLQIVAVVFDVQVGISRHDDLVQACCPYLIFGHIKITWSEQISFLVVWEKVGNGVQ